MARVDVVINASAAGVADVCLPLATSTGSILFHEVSAWKKVQVTCGSLKPDYEFAR